jgi:hypothetical protein
MAWINRIVSELEVAQQMIRWALEKKQQDAPAAEKNYGVEMGERP